MATKVPVWSTAGAVPVRNEKGDLTMEKVKVARYVSGKKPDYAGEFSDGEEDATEFGFIAKKSAASLPSAKTDVEKDDRRLRRLRERMDVTGDADDTERSSRRRRPHDPEVLGGGSDGEADDDDSMDDDEDEEREEMTAVVRGKRDVIMEESSDEEEEDLDEEEIDRRRALIRQKAKQHREDEEVMEVEEEKDEGSGEESSEWEEYTDSEEEQTGPRLKPVFVRKKDRITIQEKEKEVTHQKELLQEAKRLAEERRRQTLKMVEKEIRKEISEADKAAGIVAPTPGSGPQAPGGPLTAGVTGVVAEDDGCATVVTDDENDEQQYEAWKVRELRRVKRDRDERDAKEKEQVEVEKLRGMTEEERRLDMKMKPKVVTNKGQKGKYKFLQKYYHRGAFFLDNEDNMYTRDFSCPTLEDHFDKTILPKVMQVKNFGRSGRTKYTHLVDQDTTSYDSPWSSDMAMNLKFHINNGGGMKQTFDKPTTRKRK